MLSRRTETARITLFVLDQLLLAAAFLVACLVEARLLLDAGRFDVWAYLRLYLAAAPIQALTLAACGFYRLRVHAFPPERLRSRELLWGGLMCMAVLVGTDMVMPAGDPSGRHEAGSRGLAFLHLLGATTALALSRGLLQAANSRLRGDPDRHARVVVFGMSPRILRMLGVFERTPHMHVRVVGVAADDVPPDVAPRLTEAEALALVQEGQVDHVLVEAGAVSASRLAIIARLADREGVSLHMTASIFPSMRLVPTWERLGGVPVLGFVSAELPFGARVAKRCFDVLVGGATLLVFALPMALVALLVRADSAGPALFVQQRVGVRGRTFPMLKFRTMRVDAEASSGPTFAVENDSRCTRLGAFLRRWNIDELPQLVNVVLGHMSLVGPRPERPEFVSGFKRSIPRYAHRHWVKPGITGWAQVHGLRGASTSLDERVEHDLYYIENWSLLLDIRILVRTLLDGYVNAV